MSKLRASAKRGAATKAAQREIAERLQWHVFESDDRDDGRYVLDGYNNLVADCFADSHLGFGLPDRDDWQRNARLIARAPAMLNALKQVEIILSADCTDGKLLKAIRKLIATTGEKR